MRDPTTTNKLVTKPVPRRKGLGCLLTVNLVLAAFIALMALLIVPVSQRLTAPVLCHDSETSVVTATVTHIGNNGSNTTSRFYCVDEAQRAFPQSTFTTVLVLSAEAFVVMMLLSIVSGVRRRRRG